MYLSTKREFEALKDEHDCSLAHMDELQRNLKSEMESARSAIDVMTESTLRRADLEAQYETVLSELIDIKMKYANLGEDLDCERVKVSQQKVRIMKYAERNAALEVQLTTRIF